MRKTDYSTLAELIRATLAGLGSDIADRCTRVSVESIARRFADRASVDPAKFLAACGISEAEPSKVSAVTWNPLFRRWERPDPQNAALSIEADPPS